MVRKKRKTDRAVNLNPDTWKDKSYNFATKHVA
jgi:hypothetical protein